MKMALTAIRHSHLPIQWIQPSVGIQKQREPDYGVDNAVWRGRELDELTLRLDKDVTAAAVTPEFREPSVFYER